MSNEGSAPSPLTVGTSFVKQYYKILTTSPDKLTHFYQPTSSLSHGVGSNPSKPILREEETSLMRDRFYQTGDDSIDIDCPIRFEFENGAIDAQVSVNGGILLVVTGQIVYVVGEDQELPKSFVHTFFLGSMTTSGGKRNYYVHNDVLRFLHQEKVVAKETVTAPKNADTATTKTPIVEENFETSIADEKKDPSDNGVVAPPPVVEKQKKKQKQPAKQKAPGHGTEETKESAEAKTTDASKPVVPGSWASMVARTGGSTGGSVVSSTPSTPARSNKATNATKTPPPATKDSNNSKATTTSTANATKEKTENSNTSGVSNRPTVRPNKRDPDCTLVIKNIVDGTTQADVLGLFAPFAATNNAKVVSTTVSAHKAIAFVDYDSPAPVLAIVEQHKLTAFTLKDQTLDVYQKTLEQQKRGGGGRGGSYRGGGGGRNFRRGGGGRARGGGGGGE